MSQVFAGDAVNNPGPTTVTGTVSTPAVTSNFLNPPFGNAKAFVSGTVSLTSGTGTTAVTIRIVRNPNAENIVVAAITGVQVTAGNTLQLGIQAADAIPDGRAVQYQVNVQQTLASGNGTINFASIGTLLISG